METVCFSETFSPKDGDGIFLRNVQPKRWRQYVSPKRSALKMETVCFPEMLLSTHESTRRHNPEEHRHLHRRENDKSHGH
jgi:hypothetical protein